MHKELEEQLIETDQSDNPYHMVLCSAVKLQSQLESKRVLYLEKYIVVQSVMSLTKVVFVQVGY